jgi:hypothetical protein
MPENESKGFSLPWPAVMAVLIAAGGAMFYYSPLNTARPVSPSFQRVESLGYQDVDARLWQDPLQVTRERRNEDEQRNGVPKAEDLSVPEKDKSDARSGNKPPSTKPAEAGPSHHFSDLQKQLSRLEQQQKSTEPSTKPSTEPTSKPTEPTLVLAVMIQGGQYAELGEQRMRMRVAVLEGLALENFIPMDAEHIGYVTVPWDWKAFRNQAEAGNQIEMSMARGSGAGRLLIPYEWCRHHENGRNLLVLWLNESAFQDLPMTRLAALFSRLKWDLQKDLDFRVLGPRVSTSLRAMVEEASWGVPQSTQDTMSRVQFIAAIPTAEDYLLLKDLPGPCKPMPPETQTTVASYLNDIWKPQSSDSRKPRSTDFFQRTTLTDKELCESVIDELERGGLKIRLPASSGPPGKPGTKKKGDDRCHVALVAEWDTFYARSLQKSFLRQVYRDTETKFEVDQQEHIYFKHYLRGIDGRVPGGDRRDVNSEEGKPSSSLAEAKSAGASDRPEGQSGTDYLRRLADELRDLDRKLAKEGNDGLKAVGIMGSDVYDKLLVMRAIRDRMPDVTIFTIGMDARYNMGSEWATAHNLIIASGFGLSLQDHLQQSMPPFRDTSQTAAFFGTRMAVRNSVNKIALGTPRLYEIGRSGAVDISVNDKPDGLHPPRTDLGSWFDGHHRRAIFLTGLGVLAIAIVMLVALGVRPEKVIAHPLLTETVPYLVWVIPTILLVVRVLILSDDKFKGEPFSWTDGMSIWPTEMIRLLCSALCVHYVVRTYFAVRKSDKEIQEEFKFLDLPVRWDDAAYKKFRGPDNVYHALILPDAQYATQAKGTKKSRLYQLLRYLSFSGWYVYGPGDSNPSESATPPSADAFPNRTFFERLQLCGKNWRESRSGPRDSEINDPPRHLHFFRRLIAAWRLGPLKDPVDENKKVYAQNLWWEYKRRGAFVARLLRMFPIVCVYCGLCYLVLSLFGGAPDSPARGSFARAWDTRIMYVSAFLSIALLVFVLDATYLNKRFIELLMCTETHWPHGVFDDYFKDWNLSLELTDYLDIHLIALRTKVIGDIIYYPFVIFFLMIIGRSSLFDDWEWPLGVILFFAANMLCAISVALMLRGAAEEARSSALKKMRDGWLKLIAKKEKEKADTMAELIKEVESEKRGAFSLLSQYPVLAAILMPSGSIGAWAILEYVAKSMN